MKSQALHRLKEERDAANRQTMLLRQELVIMQNVISYFTPLC